jgi:hypothetical protein
MATGDIYEVEVHWEVADQDCINVLGFAVLTGSPTVQDLVDDIATHVGLHSETGLVALAFGHANSATIVALVGHDVKPGTAASYERSASQAGSISSPGDLLPPQDALVASLRTALKGRSFRGRTYLTGFGEVQQVAGIWQSSALGNVPEGFDWLLNRYGPSGTSTAFQWSVVSRVNGGIVRPTPVSTPVTSYSLDPVVRTQRRRQLGRGQ